MSKEMDYDVIFSGGGLRRAGEIGAAMVEVTEAAMAAMLADDPGGPVVMLNLLRFQEDGGQDRYRQYAEGTAAVAGRYGVEVLYLGAGGSALVAEEGQAWDMVVLVRYPHRQAFVDMLHDPDYRAIAHLRTEALSEAVLQPTVPIGA